MYYSNLEFYYFLPSVNEFSIIYLFFFYLFILFFSLERFQNVQIYSSFVSTSNIDPR